MMQLKLGGAQILRPQGEFPAQPDVGSVPSRAHFGTRSSFRAKATGAFVPHGVVEVGKLPLFTGVVGRKSPNHPAIKRVGDNHAHCLFPIFTAIRRLQNRQIKFGNGPVISKQAVAFRFHIGGLSINRRAKSK